MFNHLTGGRANVQLLQEAAVRDLVEILDRCEGTKVGTPNVTKNWGVPISHSH